MSAISFSEPRKLHLHRLLCVGNSKLSSVDLRDDLVCDDDRDTKLWSAFTSKGG